MYQNILVPVDGSDTAAKAGREVIVAGDAEYIVRHSPVPVLVVRGS